MLPRFRRRVAFTEERALASQTAINVVVWSKPVLLVGVVSMLIFYERFIESRLGRIEDKVDLVDRRVSPIEGRIKFE